MQIVINGLLTNYQVYGNKDNPCFLILHGWQSSLSDWKRIAKTLSDDYYVILLDLPGFGGTAQPQTTFGIFDYSDFVEAFVNKLEVKSNILLGHSFGGRIGIILGSKTSPIEKLILVDSAGTEKSRPLYNMFLLVAKPLSRVFSKSVVNKVKQLLGSRDYLKAGAMREIFKKVISEDLTYLLNDINVPTLVVWGSADEILDVKTTKILKKNIKDCIVRIVWAAGHHPHIEKEDTFVEIIKEFLNE